MEGFTWCGGPGGLVNGSPPEAEAKFEIIVHFLTLSYKKYDLMGRKTELGQYTQLKQF